MKTSTVHAQFGSKGLFEGVDDFPKLSLKAEFKSILIADAKEFMNLISSVFQPPKFSYSPTSSQSSEYLEQKNKLTLYNRLLKLYFNSKICIELAYLKARVLMEKHGIKLSISGGRLANFYNELKDHAMEVNMKMTKDLIERANSSLPFHKRFINNVFLLFMKLSYGFVRLVFRFRTWAKPKS